MSAGVGAQRPISLRTIKCMAGGRVSVPVNSSAHVSMGGAWPAHACGAVPAHPLPCSQPHACVRARAGRRT